MCTFHESACERKRASKRGRERERERYARTHAHTGSINACTQRSINSRGHAITYPPERSAASSAESDSIGVEVLLVMAAGPAAVEPMVTQRRVSMERPTSNGNELMIITNGTSTAITIENVRFGLEMSPFEKDLHTAS